MTKKTMDRWRRTVRHFLKKIKTLKRGMSLPVQALDIKEGRRPHRRSVTIPVLLILAMENAGQLIEDEELRAQIKGSGIGTSATRAEILKKLIQYQISMP